MSAQHFMAIHLMVEIFHIGPQNMDFCTQTAMSSQTTCVATIDLFPSTSFHMNFQLQKNYKKMSKYREKGLAEVEKFV